MASDFFRIDRGLVIDEQAQITTRIGTPSTPDEAAAKIGSLFQQLDTASNFLNIWYKFKNNTGTVADWMQLSSKAYADSVGGGGGPFTITGDVTGTIDGGVDVLTLANVNASVGTYGSGTQIPVITVNAKGLVTSVTTAPVSGGGGPSLVLYSENPSTPTNAAATGLNAVAIGFGSDAGAAKSLAIGEQALTRIPGSVAIASGRFGTQGDAQVGKYLLRATTPGNVPTELLVGGNGGSKLTVPDDSTWTFRATITGHETTPGNGHAGFEITGVVYRGSGAGTVAFQGTPNVSIIGRSSTAWKAAVDVDTVNGSLKISVTGQNGKIIRWLGHVETVEVTN